MTVILLRHGRSTSNTAGILAGRSDGVDLDDKGREQAAGLIDRIGDLPIRAVVSSPLLRCRRTVEPLADALCLEPLIDDRLAEVDYGEWTGRKIGDLTSEPLWKVVQAHPSAAVFPGGEGLAQVQARAVAAVREHDRRLALEHGGEHGEEHGGDALWVACTHGDVIKAVVADAYGMHLDGFQRVTADPASVSVIRYTSLRPFVLHVNHTGTQLSAALRAAPPPKDESKGDESHGQSEGEPQNGPAEVVPPSDAVVGGTTD
jgi:probable phosphomutase (TIGR03848 family)